MVTDKDKEFVGHIVRNLEAANQEVSKELMDLVRIMTDNDAFWLLMDVVPNGRIASRTIFASTALSLLVDGRLLKAPDKINPVGKSQKKKKKPTDSASVKHF